MARQAPTDRPHERSSHGAQAQPAHLATHVVELVGSKLSKVCDRDSKPAKVLALFRRTRGST
jgi:hypothetical protein